MRYVSYQTFVDAQKRLSVDEGELCKILGFHQTTWNRWRFADKLPRVVGLACSYLITCSDPDVLEGVIKDHDS